MKSCCYTWMMNTDPTSPSGKFTKLITPLLQKLASILMQLKTGHVPLAKHLHHISKTDSPTCPTCQQNEETIQHLMLHCPTHQTTRQTLQNDTKGRNINLKELFTNPKTLQALFTYIAETEWFHAAFGNLPKIEE
jgi:hypothetical protein